MTDYSCGVVPVVFDGGFRRYLLVRHAAGHWAFPKGHPEGAETLLETARRELAEETGLTRVDLLEAPAFSEAYAFTKRSGKRVRKRVDYVLGRVWTPAAVVLQEAEVGDHAWGRADETAARMTFQEGRDLLAEVEAFARDGGAASIGLP